MDLIEYVADAGEVAVATVSDRCLSCRPRSTEAGDIKGPVAMPFDGRSKVSVDHDPDAVARALRESAGETIAALDHLAALFDGGRRWIRNKECDEKGRFCLRGGIAHIAAGECIRHYLKLAIRELAGPSMTIPAYNDNAPSFASIAYVIDRARELAAAAEANRQT
jgi:hypothetical protein